jgi:hypothetical protein
MYLINGKFSALAKYNQNVSSYHCPSDNSVVSGIGPRVRTYSMNSAIGTVFNHPSKATPAGGPMPVEFLDGDGGYGGVSTYSKYWQTYAKLGNIKNPSGTWTILDENPFSINDAVFAVAMGIPDAGGNAVSTHFVDTPGSYHNGACGVSFSDGHSEIHKWLGGAVKITAAPTAAYPASDALSLQDLKWLQTRTTVPK